MSNTDCFKKYDMNTKQLSLDMVNISGNIKNGFGDNLNNANIYIQNNDTVGTMSDQNGSFNLDHVNHGQTIVISYLGYRTVLIKADRDNIRPYDVVMELESETLDEVIVLSKKAKWILLGLSVAAAAAIYISADDTKKTRPTPTPTPTPKGLSATKPVKFNL